LLHNFSTIYNHRIYKDFIEARRDSVSFVNPCITSCLSSPITSKQHAHTGNLSGVVWGISFCMMSVIFFYKWL